MWHTLDQSPKSDPDFVRSVNELLQSTSRNLILAPGGIYAVWHFAAMVFLSEKFWDVLLISLVVTLTSALAYHLGPKQLKLSGKPVFAVPLSTWILITFFNEIPRELDEAAYVDGASPITAFLHKAFIFAATCIPEYQDW